MKASEARQRTKIAEEQGHDRTIVETIKKIKFATECNETEVCLPVLPWYKFEDKHVQFFTANGYTVEVGKESIMISWQGEF